MMKVTKASLNKRGWKEKTVFSLPTMDSSRGSKEIEDRIGKGSRLRQSLLAKFVKVFFVQGKSDLKEQYNGQLNDIMQIAERNPGLGIEISVLLLLTPGRANRELSNEARHRLLDVFNHQGRLYQTNCGQRLWRCQGRDLYQRGKAAG